MLALGALVLLVAVLVGASRAGGRFGRRPESGSQPGGADPAAIAAPDRSWSPSAEALARWVDAGLIDVHQAESIEHFEHERRISVEPVDERRVPVALEAIGYVGGILVAVGAVMLLSRFWDDLRPAGQVSLVWGAAALTGIVGGVVGETDPVTWRLRGFLWALSAAGAAAGAGLVAAEVLDLAGEPVTWTVGATGAAASFAYWRLRDRPLQHLLTFVGVAVSTGAAIAWLGGDRDVGAAIGLALWLFGALWATLAWRDRIPPALIGFPLGVALTLVASAIMNQQFEHLAPLVGLATAAGWVALGIAVDEPIAVAPGLLGLFVFLPWTLGAFFGESAGAPVITMVSGIVLLIVVFVLVRRRRFAGPARPSRLHRTPHGAAPTAL